MSRVDIVMTGLTNMTLNPIILNTQQLIELYRESYNIGISEKQPLEDINNLQVDQDAIAE